MNVAVVKKFFENWPTGYLFEERPWNWAYSYPYHSLKEWKDGLWLEGSSEEG